MAGGATAGWIARAGLLLASLALVLVPAELLLRRAAGDPWWERIEAEQSHTTLERFPVGSDRLPLRRAPEAGPKPEGTHRTLFLGDSFTYGLGVGEDETFVAHVVERLNAAPPRGELPRYEAYNGGIPGSLPFQWRDLLRDLGDAYAPDLVVAVFFVRDGVLGVTTSEPIDAIRREMQQLEETSWAYRHLHLVRFVRARIEQRRLAGRYLERLREGYLSDDPAQRRGWDAAQADLLWLRARSRRAGADFALVIFPMLYDLGDGHPLLEAYDEIERFAHAQDIPVLSLFPAFRGQRGPDLWVSTHDQHPNASGHRIAADALHPYLAERIASPE